MEREVDQARKWDLLGESMRRYFIISNHPVNEFRVGFRDDDDPMDEIYIDTDIEPSNSIFGIRRIVESFNNSSVRVRL